VESSFNPNAYSRIGAIGLWQFIRRTARQMIHEDSPQKWRDPVAQSKAAARMLKLNRTVLPDWGLAITAYNSGVGRVRRLTQKYGVEGVDSMELIPTTEDFGFAGRNFFAEVLAVNLLENYKDVLFERELRLIEPSLVYNKN
jgi:membrane-bound lytic murein transglycosylase D